MLVDDVKRELATLTRNYSVIQETADSMSFYYSPIGCKCGGGVAVIYDLPNDYSVALWEGLKEVRQIASQGFHFHYREKVKNK